MDTEAIRPECTRVARITTPYFHSVASAEKAVAAYGPEHPAVLGVDGQRIGKAPEEKRAGFIRADTDKTGCAALTGKAEAACGAGRFCFFREKQTHGVTGSDEGCGSASPLLLCPKGT